MSTIFFLSLMLLIIVALYFILFKVRKVQQPTSNVVKVPSFSEKVTLLRQYFRNNGKIMRQKTLLENTDHILNKFFNKNG